MDDVPATVWVGSMRLSKGDCHNDQGIQLGWKSSNALLLCPPEVAANQKPSYIICLSRTKAKGKAEATHLHRPLP